MDETLTIPLLSAVSMAKLPSSLVMVPVIKVESLRESITTLAYGMGCFFTSTTLPVIFCAFACAIIPKKAINVAKNLFIISSILFCYTFWVGIGNFVIPPCVNDIHPAASAFLKTYIFPLTVVARAFGGYTVF